METRLKGTLFTILMLGLISIANGQGFRSDLPLASVVEQAKGLMASQSNWQVMTGTGRSMVPLYGSGDVLVVSGLRFDQLRPGMVAVYQDASGERVGHRLVENHGTGWTAQGVNNRDLDPCLVTPDNLIGVVVGVLHSRGDAESVVGIPVVVGKRR